MTVDETKREPPPWLNLEYFTKNLREALNDTELVVKSCDIKPAVAVGDNYASLMFRATLVIIKGSSEIPETLSLVCKTLPLGMAKELMSQPFDTESKMLRDVLPIMNKALLNAVPDFQPLSAECIYKGLEPEYVIIMQDLKVMGFTLADRMSGLNMNNSRLALKAMAQLHAGSLMMIQTNPELMESLRHNFWNEQKDDFLKNMMNSSLSSLIEAASEWEDFRPDYFEKLKNLKENFWNKMLEIASPTDNDLLVLQHGDCWINNMMFKGDGSNYNEFRFVDYQISNINSAGMDLNYFIFTSPTADIRVTKMEEMLQFYYNTFMDVTEKLGAHVPKTFTYEELKRDFKRRAFFGFVATVIVYPITITEEKDVREVNDFFDVEISKKNQYNIKKFRNVFNMVLPYFIECGVL